MNDEQKNQTTFLPMNELNIRRKCLEWTLEFVKGESVMRKNDFVFCGMQDLKCQIVDCAKALSEFLLEGKTTENIVGKTTLLLSPSRLLGDRKIALSVAAFNELMQLKGLMKTEPFCRTLTETGLAYGQIRLVEVGNQSVPYFYDNKFDELLLLLGITGDKNIEKTSRTTKKERTTKAKEA